MTPDPADRRVLLIAATTGYQIRSFGEAARTLGVRLLFASDRCDHLDDPWRDAAIPIRFHDPGASTRQIVEALGDARLDGIVAVGDRPAMLAAHVAEATGLPGNSIAAAARSRDKQAAREAFRSAGLLTPAFQPIRLDAGIDRHGSAWSFPVVVKPLALSGSRGVIRANDEEELAAACQRLRRLLASADIREERDELHDGALIESFIPGREFAVEGVLTQGAFTCFAIFEKPDPLDGPFFEETIYLTPPRVSSGDEAAIVDAVRAAAAALGLRHGPVHAECRVNDRGVFVLEVAPRPIGGLCSKTLRFASADGPVPLEAVLLRHAIGEPIAHLTREPMAAGVMMIPIPARGVFKGIDGVEAARRVTGIEDVQITAKPDTMLTPLPEGRSYLGFLFARAGSADLVEAALREAHRRLRFRIVRELPMVDTG